MFFQQKLPVSPVLKEIGLKKDLPDSTVRFSFCENTTKEELEYCLPAVKGTACGAPQMYVQDMAKIYKVK